MGISFLLFVGGWRWDEGSRMKGRGQLLGIEKFASNRDNPFTTF
jgi:hypothetical protein